MTKQPKDWKIGDTFDNLILVEIKDTVNGIPTYASTFVFREIDNDKTN